MKVIIAGAGTYGSVYHKYLIDEAKLDVIGFVDDDNDKIGKIINGLKVICHTRQFETLKELGVEGVICTIGINKIRQRILQEYLANGFELPGFIHESVIMSDDVKIGKAVYILPGTIIMPFVEIHDFTMISIGTKIAHHSILREGSFLAGGVNMGANINFGICSFAGYGSTISTGVKRIGNFATIGAGAVIIHDVPDNAVVVGNPGRIIKYNQ